MPVSGSFVRSPVNTSGDLENHIAVYDQAANAPAVSTPVGKMQGISFGNLSDNFAKATITLTDTQGSDTDHDVLLVPNGSEQYNFEGRFIKSVTIAAVDEPMTAGSITATALVASASAYAGLVDINFIEA